MKEKDEAAADSLSGRFDQLLTGLGVVVLAAIPTILLVQIVGRYIFNVGFPWIEELSRFLLIWVTMLGAWVAARRGAHFRMDIFTRDFGRIGVVVLGAVELIALGVLVYGGFRLLPRLMGTTSPTLGWSMGLVLAPVTAIAFLMAVDSIVSTVSSWKEHNGGAAQSRGFGA